MNSLFVLMFLSGLEVTVVDLLLVALLLLVTRVFKVFVKLFNCVATCSFIGIAHCGFKG